MSDDSLFPLNSSAQLPYQWLQAFRNAVRIGEQTRALELVAVDGAETKLSAWLASSWGDEYTPLMIALDPMMHPEHGVDLQLVWALLEAGAPVNGPVNGPVGRPEPLNAAVESGSLAAVELLLARGANVNVKHDPPWYGRGEETKSLLVLVRAIELGHNAIALRLLEADADPHGTEKAPRPLQVAALKGNVEVTRALLAHGAKVDAQWVDESNPGAHTYSLYPPSATALMLAASVPGNPVLPVLLDAGANPNARSDIGRIALQGAIQDVRITSHFSPDIENTRLLLDAGADPNASESLLVPLIRRLGFSTMRVERADNFALMELLLNRGADPNRVDDFSRTPLSVAIRDREIEVALLLLKFGAHWPQDSLREFWILAEAGDAPSHRELAALLEARGSSPEAHLRQVGLWEAISSDDAGRVRLLLSRGANCNAIHHKGYTPLHIAAAYGAAETVRIFLAAGADLEARTPDGCTPLMWAVDKFPTASTRKAKLREQEMTDEEKREWINEQRLKTVQVLLQAGADVEAHDDKGYTPLHYATTEGTPDMVRVLLEAGADVNRPDNKNRAALHQIIGQGRRRNLLKERPQLLYSALIPPPNSDLPHVQESVRELNQVTLLDSIILQLLLSYGADVNQPGHNNAPPIILAATLATLSVAHQLLEAGADINVQWGELTVESCVLYCSHTRSLFRRMGFDLDDFPFVGKELQSAIGDFETSLETLLPNASLLLRATAREDVEMARLLFFHIAKNEDN